jgi:hypothetical protein
MMKMMAHQRILFWGIDEEQEEEVRGNITGNASHVPPFRAAITWG